MEASPPPPEAIATNRTPGYDVARALAVLGMVLVNFKGKLGATENGPEWLIWLSNRLEGRAAALFVLLAGVGISLRSRKAREGLSGSMRSERVALLKRAGILFCVGLLNLHMWDWDILHFYGVYLGIAAVIIGVRSAFLWLGAAVFVLGSVGLQLGLDYGQDSNLWTPAGMVRDLAFNGLHPVFPWMAFLLVGVWVGRQDLRDGKIRNRIFAAAIVAALAGEGLGASSPYLVSVLDLTGGSAGLLQSWPRPPSPVYVLGAGGAAVALVCLAISITQPQAGARWVTALTATGQMAFTLYLAHAVAILIPLQHGLFEDASLATSIAYSFGFYLVAIAASVWWRRRWTQGPLEALIRRITGRTEPAPWGGALIRQKPPPPTA